MKFIWTIASYLLLSEENARNGDLTSKLKVEKMLEEFV